MPEPFVFCGVGVADLPAAVRGAVVDDDDLDLFHRLTCQAIQAALQPGLYIIDRNDHTDQRFHDTDLP